MTDRIGDFEQLILFALVRLAPEVYGVTIRREIERRTKRTISPGALYTALDRMEKRGFLSSRLGEPTPERGGKRKRLYTLEAAGERALARVDRIPAADGERRRDQAARGQRGIVTPPRLAALLLRPFVSRDDFEAITGDLEELYRADIVPGRGPLRARLWYWRQIVSVVAAHVLSLHEHSQPTPKGTTMAAVRQDLVRRALAAQATRLHGNRPAHACARHRCERRDLLARERRAAQAAPVRRAGSADGRAPA